MLTLSLYATAALALADGASALFPRAVAGKGYLSVPVGTVENKRHDRSKFRRDDGDFVEQILQNKEFWYSAEIGFGNPPQNITVLVDTGSSKLWINPDCDNAQTQDQATDCETFGRYDPDDSSTPPVGPFNREVLSYGDPSDERTKTEVILRYFSDDLWFGDAKLENQTFGVAASSSGIAQPIFGLGPDLKEGFDGTQPHSLVLHSMAEQGLIGGRVFALDLRHSESTVGAVIYGGVDRNRFIGKLESVPVEMGTGGLYRLAVELESIGVTTMDGTKTWSQGSDGIPKSNVLIDSGSTLSRFHYDVAYPILKALEAEDTGDGYYVVPCSTRKQEGGVEFGFGKRTITVPFTDFIVDLGDPEYCYVGLAVTSEQQIIGDTIMRAGYFVFDWDNEEVHIGQAANCGEPDIVAIGVDVKNIGDVEGKCKSKDALWKPSSTSESASSTSSSSSDSAKTKTKDLPTAAYTTTFTVSTCLPFDRDCEVGALTTETIDPAGAPTTEPTSGSGASDSNDDGNDDGNKDDDEDEEDAGSRPRVWSSVLVVCGIMAGVMNLML